jgi:hypothetical protein
MALIALIIVAVAENARIPVDNPTAPELTMVHQAGAPGIPAGIWR